MQDCYFGKLYVIRYFGKFMQLLQNHFLAFFKRTIENKTKDYECTAVILDKLRDVEIFSNKYERKLCTKIV